MGGCVSYTDPKLKGLDESQYATVSVDLSLNIEEIDGEKVPLNWLTTIDTFRLAPGPHVFKIAWDNVNIRSEPIILEVGLEAGKKYNLLRTADQSNRTWNVKFEIGTNN